MNIKRLIIILISLLTSSMSAYAGETLGDVLDNGAKRVTKSEFISMLPAVVFFEWLEEGGEATLIYKSDGTFKGKAREYNFNTESGSSGTWKMDKDGKKCIDEYFISWPTSYKGCWYYFRIGKQYYVAKSDTDRSTVIKKATITRVE